MPSKVSASEASADLHSINTASCARPLELLPNDMFKIIFSYTSAEKRFAHISAMERVNKHVFNTINVNSMESNIWVYFFNLQALSTLLGTKFDPKKPLRKQLTEYCKFVKAAGIFDEINIPLLYATLQFFFFS